MNAGRTGVQEFGSEHVVHVLEDVETGRLLDDGDELLEELQLQMGQNEIQTLRLAFGAHRDHLSKPLHTLFAVGASVICVWIHSVIGVQNHLLGYGSREEANRTAEICVENT